jgi:non-heme chloroperoxidase
MAGFVVFGSGRTNLKAHKISGGRNIELHVVETENQRGRPILFLHGASQSWLTWNLQRNSNLADSHRLIAMDLRGHGFSDKPHDAYTDSKLWPMISML